MGETKITGLGSAEMVIGKLKASEFLPRERGSMFRAQLVPTELEKKAVPLLIRPDDRGRFSHGWRILYRAGLPVPRLYNISSTADWVAVEDVTADGSKLYGRDSLDNLRRSNSEIELDDRDRSFISLVMETPGKIDEAAQALIVQAANAGIELPWDDMFELKVKSPDDWKLIILDPEETRTGGHKETLLTNMNHIFKKLKEIWEDQAKLLKEKATVTQST